MDIVKTLSFRDLQTERRLIYVSVCVKVYRYLLRSNVVRNPRKAYRSLVQDTTVADNRNHYDLHQFDKKQEETLMAFCWRCI